MVGEARRTTRQLIQSSLYSDSVLTLNNVLACVYFWYTNVLTAVRLKPLQVVAIAVRDLRERVFGLHIEFLVTRSGGPSVRREPALFWLDKRWIR